MSDNFVKLLFNFSLTEIYFIGQFRQCYQNILKFKMNVVTKYFINIFLKKGDKNFFHKNFKIFF